MLVSGGAALHTSSLRAILRESPKSFFKKYFESKGIVNEIRILSIKTILESSLS